MYRPPNFKRVAEQLRSAPCLIIDFPAFTAFQLVALLHLVLRHQQLKELAPEVANTAKGLISDLSEALGQVGPDIKQALDQGWDEGLDATPEEYAKLEAGEMITTHNVYTLYEKDSSGNILQNPTLGFERPNNWGNKDEWTYYTCQIQADQGEFLYRNVCHIWQQVKRSPTDAFQLLASYLFVVMMPGLPWQVCGDQFLDLDDEWLPEWGETPPTFEGD